MSEPNNNLLWKYAGLATQFLVGIGLAVYAGIKIDERLKEKVAGEEQLPESAKMNVLRPRGGRTFLSGTVVLQQGDPRHVPLDVSQAERSRYEVEGDRV